LRFFKARSTIVDASFRCGSCFKHGAGAQVPLKQRLTADQVRGGFERIAR
jgi:hypothetical protein